jgi:hypothetical protein
MAVTVHQPPLRQSECFGPGRFAFVRDGFCLGLSAVGAVDAAPPWLVAILFRSRC